MLKMKGSIIQRMAQKNLASNRGRNIFLAVTIFIMTLTAATIISLCVSRTEMQRLYMSAYQGTEGYQTEPILYVLAMPVILLAVAV